MTLALAEARNQLAQALKQVGPASLTPFETGVLLRVRQIGIARRDLLAAIETRNETACRNELSRQASLLSIYCLTNTNGEKTHGKDTQEQNPGHRLQRAAVA